jgi:hypothetical protein
VTTWQSIGVGVGAGLIVVSLVEAYIILRWGEAVIYGDAGDLEP